MRLIQGKGREGFPVWRFDGTHHVPNSHVYLEPDAKEVVRGCLPWGCLYLWPDLKLRLARPESQLGHRFEACCPRAEYDLKQLSGYKARLLTSY